MLDRYGVARHSVGDSDDEEEPADSGADDDGGEELPPEEARASAVHSFAGRDREEIDGAGPSAAGAADDGLDAELGALGDQAFVAMGKLVRRKASHSVIAEALDCFERLQRLRRHAAADA